ncbi:MAG: CcmD family protein [Bacteroidota bacterium]
MEAYGKIFVVVAVLAVILVGIFGYLFTIDRKVKKLEEEMDSKSTNKQK